MDIEFWGVRGSIAVSGTSYVRVGGNTPCVAITHRSHRLILDGGTGLASLGAQFGFRPLDASLLFTHVHWDHIQGVPFFAPAFHPDSRLELAGPVRGGHSIRSSLETQMRPPSFPIGLDALVGVDRFVEVAADGSFELGPFSVRARALDHPDGVCAYRIDAGGRAVVFATDVEHGDTIDPRLVELACGADLLIHDAQYTAEEYAGAHGRDRRGWGHSTWCDAVEVAVESRAERLALFHHDPGRDDAAVHAIERSARARFRGAFAAREREIVTL